MANMFTSKQDQGFLDNLAQLDALGLLANTWEAARDQFLGIDDLRRAGQKASEGNLGGAAKSLATAGLELGTTLLPFLKPAKLAKLGKAGKLARLFGAGSKTPVRGIAGNVAGTTAVGYGVPAVGRRLPVVGGLFAEVPPAVRRQLVSYDPYAGMSAMMAGSPAAADSEALMRLMAAEGMI